MKKNFMNKNLILSASRLAVLALACTTVLSIASCGGDDDDTPDPSPDEVLSDKTTPVTFRIDNGMFYMYDYAGSRFIGADTIKVYNGKYHADGSSFPNDVEIDLRQGRHHLIWLKQMGKSEYNPQTKMISMEDGQTVTDAEMAECDVNVSEYLLPAQKLEFKPVTAQLLIVIQETGLQEGRQYGTATIKGIPTIKSASVVGGDVVTGTSTSHTLQMKASGGYLGIYMSDKMLCPHDGLNDIQLEMEVVDNDGNPVATMTLPKFSMKPGKITGLVGPVFTGTAADWKVKMGDYEE